MHPAPGRPVNCAYGTKGDWWATGWHSGIDYGCPHGDPVYAMWDGVVTSFSWGSSSYGNHIVIDHDTLPDGRPGLWAVYAHLNKELVSPGNRVQAGQLIAYSDNTGNSSGAHLHVEVQPQDHWVQGSSVNPQPWIDAGGSGSSSGGGSGEDEDMPTYKNLNTAFGRNLGANAIGAVKWQEPSEGVSLVLDPAATKVIARGVVSLDKRPDWMRIVFMQKNSSGDWENEGSLGPAVDVPDLGKGVYSIDAQGSVPKNSALRLEVKAPGGGCAVLEGGGILSAMTW